MTREPVAADVPVEAREQILAWYDRLGRSLPFRGTRDPYAILVSEVMAQQTQVERVGEAWRTFLDAFSSFEALAAATPAEVLRAWRGLGYNRRAVNLWRAAKVVVAEHDGRLPADLDALQRLPGIGPYTARAVAAIAFGQKVGAVDTNVRRVLGRIVGGAVPPPPARLQAIADDVTPPDRAADWTHALMDVGATFCRARPLCDACPARAWCRFALDGATANAGRPRAAPDAFESTTRWLRGRLLDVLRGADGWLTFDGALGTHPPDAVERALDAMAREGLVELDALQGPGRRARLPLA